jgi:oligosaccharyltransferase complex subunit gamma
LKPPPPTKPNQKQTQKQLAELRALRSKARDRVIVLSSEQFERYAKLAPPPSKKGGKAAADADGDGDANDKKSAQRRRPYALTVFMSAKHMMDSPKTRLRDLRFEYALAARAFAEAPPPSAPAAADDADSAADGAPPSSPPADVFFVELWHHASKDLFNRLGVKALPMVFVISPTHPGPPGDGGQIKIPEADEMGRDGAAAAGFTKYPWAAEEMCAWLEKRVPGSSSAPVDRPSFVKSPLFPLAFAGFLVTGAGVAWRLYNSRLARQTWLWGAASLGVWWFSTSGGMFNIIRGMPLVGGDPQRPGRVAWWMSSRTAQFGMEGFVMGSSYVLFSALLGAAVFSAPKLKGKGARGAVSAACLGVAWLVLMRILDAYDSKTSLGKQRQFIGFI